MVALEFQAVVMAAGRGSRMTELTGCRPKCLLPIGNYPMVWYPLQMLERIGFQEAIVIVPEEATLEIQSIPSQFGLKIKLDVVPVSAGEDCGTADSLRLVHGKIKTDVMVVGCDLITNASLHQVLDLFRVHRASVTALFAKPTSHDSTPAVAPGPKSRHKPERDLVGVDPVTSRLVFLASEADFDEQVWLRRALLRKHQRVTVHSSLVDAHLYLLRKWVCDYLAEERSFSTLKGEFLPHLVKKQLSKPTSKADHPDTHASVISVECKKDIFSFTTKGSNHNEVLSRSAWNDHIGDMHSAYHDDPIRCYAYVMDGGICVRANTLASYCDLNKQIVKVWSSITQKTEFVPVHPNSSVKSNQVGPDCIIGEGTEISEKTSIKHCVIGNHCRIEEKTRLANCIVMDRVVIKEGSCVQGSVVCDGARLEERCDIRDCLVGRSHVVHSGAKHTNEILTEVASMMEI